MSLAWWAPDEPIGRREPVLVAGPRSARTLVVVWPTCARGYVDRARLDRGEVEVLPWDLDAATFQRIRDLGPDWPLEWHDLYVTSTWIGPARESLRHTDFWSVPRDAVETAIRSWGA